MSEGLAPGVDFEKRLHERAAFFRFQKPIPNHALCAAPVGMRLWGLRLDCGESLYGLQSMSAWLR